MNPETAIAMAPEIDESAAESAEGAVGLLSALGEQVRDLRSQRGMTRKILARDSGVSERYLAQLEAGIGNGSILLLAKVAAALSVPVTALLHAERRAAPEFEALQQLLRRLSPLQLKAARDLLAREFDEIGRAHV